MPKKDANPTHAIRIAEDSVEASNDNFGDRPRARLKKSLRAAKPVHPLSAIRWDGNCDEPSRQRLLSWPLIKYQRPSARPRGQEITS